MPSRLETFARLAMLALVGAWSVLVPAVLSFAIVSALVSVFAQAKTSPPTCADLTSRAGVLLETMKPNIVTSVWTDGATRDWRQYQFNAAIFAMAKACGK